MAEDVWASGDAYEPYVGRWSRGVAREFVRWLAVPPGSRWIEAGCGTGALTSALVELASPGAVRACDPSAGYLEYARRRLADERVTFAVADARSLPDANGGYDAAVSGLVLNFVPDPAAAVREQVRVTRPGATVAAYVWDYAGEMQLIRRFWDAAVELDPAAGELDEGRRFPLCRPVALRELFQAAGLEAVEVRPIDVPTRFRDFDDYWAPFLGGQGPAPGYAMSLPPALRDRLRELIRSRLPVDPDGSIPLTAHAWAVRGTRPASAGAGRS